MVTTRRGRKVAALTAAAVVVVLAVTIWQSWPHIRFWWMFESLERNAQGYPEYRHRQTGIVFVGLPGGTSIMGTSKEEESHHYTLARKFEIISAELPQKRVKVGPFLIAKYEVKQIMWEKIMGSNPSYFKGDNLPIESVSWNDCNEFCNKTGLKLPSDPEWEYACRAGTSGPFSGSGFLGELGWYNENSGGKTHPVGQMKPNQFGLHDMHGNVWEWCEDVIEFLPERWVIGTNRPVYYNRAVRGGGWCSQSYHCSSATQGHYPPDRRYYGIGFRPCFNLSR